MKHGSLIPVVVVALLVLALASLTVSAKAADSAKKDKEYYKTIYPCTKCHAGLNLNGMSKKSSFHKIDLTKGAHRGLYCANCHVAPTMIQLHGDAFVFIPGYHNRSLVMQTNKLCAICHPKEYKDYMNLVHANKTYVCPGGKVEIVHGYKDINYDFHICPNGYKNLKTVPARACVECHDPHDPVFKPLNILPKPSEKPAPPPQRDIAIGNVLAIIGALVPIAFALVARFSDKTPLEG
ncbi:hypothetical protein PYJP_05470 [Pyrofollis japonicus]|uniref:hypothetical protein n=1 Tax=Pyrofollis japonicus TaxID=3060460 RepID=UPI00295A6A57|nr:hypothetical protein [Pyrofollis japonicus]BEP17195.1 hypothetical protein PYJP_05470 [Pyrofollis japonicus]